MSETCPPPGSTLSRPLKRGRRSQAVSDAEDGRAADSPSRRSANEDPTLLNHRLQETLERERAVFNDLQNVLHSTGVATIFLGIDLEVRLFTPAVTTLFSLVPGDVGRPLADLRSLASDGDLLDDAAAVLRTALPVEREIEARNGAWYIRRVLPCRTQEDRVAGVVITFTDITGRRHAADALEAAKRLAESATVAKSRFLAAASHDLRQPLQTLTLLQGLLETAVEGEKARTLVARFDDTLRAMSGMLNSLLDINQIEAGTVHGTIVPFAIDGLLDRLRDEFDCHAQAQGLALRVVPCGLSVASDPHLLEQMVRNLLSNALKYTERGKVLVGCRRRGAALVIEIWDTGAGIPGDDLQTIFEEYRQLGNAARERSRGLGLGLSIVRRLGDLLGHRISVRSQPGRGSVFTVEVALSSAEAERLRPALADGAGEGVHRAGTILVVEDDPELRELLGLLLVGEGHDVATAADGVAALDLVGRGVVRPDLILADCNLPNGMDGIQVGATLRKMLARPVPIIILTGDLSTGTLRDIAQQDCEQLQKPVNPKELTRLIQRLLPPFPAVAPTHAACPAEAPAGIANDPPRSVVFVVDDDRQIRAGLREVLEEDGRRVEDYADCESFLAAYRPVRNACLLVDATMPGMSGLALLRRLRESGHRLPAIMITGNSDVPTAVQAMRAGALDFIEKPVGRGELLASVGWALEQSRDSGKLSAWRETAADHVAGLTARQRQIMILVLAGHPSKNIAADLGISQRTVENHRASIMKRTGSKSLPALARLALAAAWDGIDEPFG